jgi:hypothetical protein
MLPGDGWDGFGEVTRRGLLALGVAGLVTVDDVGARKRKKKRRRKRKRKKNGTGGPGNTPGPVLPVLRPFPQQLTYGAVRPSR